MSIAGRAGSYKSMTMLRTKQDALLFVRAVLAIGATIIPNL